VNYAVPVFFLHGAVVTHSKSGAKILVGGTCLKTFQRHRFPRYFRIQEAKQFTFETLSQHYGPVVDPGTWIAWTIQHAPRRLAQPVADLQSFGFVVNSEELQALIRFHDKTRLFPRRALLEDPRLIESILSIKIPSHITFHYATQILRKFRTAVSDPQLRLRIESEQYAKNTVRPYISGYTHLSAPWSSLLPIEKRALTALAALDDRASKEGTPLCPDEIAEMWPTPGARPMFVWNHRIGLGFVGPDDALEGHKSRVWIWRSGRLKRGVYDLQYWRGISGCSTAAVGRIEQLAFPDTEHDWPKSI
jgi:hypothetical protein